MPNVQASAVTDGSPPATSEAIPGAKPNATFTSVQTRSPKHSILFGFTLSPTTPFTNLESP